MGCRSTWLLMLVKHPRGHAPMLGISRHDKPQLLVYHQGTWHAWCVSCFVPPLLNAHSFIMLDDMALPSTVKRSLLRNFHVHIRRKSGADFATHDAAAASVAGLSWSWALPAAEERVEVLRGDACPTSKAPWSSTPRALRHALDALDRLPPPPQEPALHHPLATHELCFENARLFLFGGNVEMRTWKAGAAEGCKHSGDSGGGTRRRCGASRSHCVASSSSAAAVERQGVAARGVVLRGWASLREASGGLASAAAGVETSLGRWVATGC
ncbi:hypothetical protein DFH09DRAFT_1073181 [Mycena vulgaris]|nr:hypothetical protein DFH09DRAFT_1073181 [Mycena vulgaris]